MSTSEQIYTLDKDTAMREKNERIQFLIINLINISAVLCSYALAIYIRHGRQGWFVTQSHITVVLYIILLYILITFIRNGNRSFLARGRVKELWECIKESTILISILIVTLFAARISNKYSRLVLVNFYLLMIILGWIFRVGYKQYLLWMKKVSFYTKRLVVVTMMDFTEEILHQLQSEEMWNYKLKGFILLDAPDHLIERGIHGVQVMGNYSSMYDCITQRVVDEVFINVPYFPGLHIEDVVEHYEAMGITVNLNINVYNLNLKHRNKELRPLGGYYVIAFRQSVVDIKMLAFKRFTDILGAAAGLVLTGIITVFLAPILLLESPGPLFFTQTRIGLNGRRFKIYKFRSMYRDAEARKKDLLEKNEMSGLMFKVENDPRITKVGRFIRKTSIDELPQFWNVLKGDMSLIGTRPPTLDEFEKYKAEYKRRLSIRPGITGLWQATGRSRITDFEEILALDLEYIDNWSVTMDIRILFLTVFEVFRGRGAM